MTKNTQNRAYRFAYIWFAELSPQMRTILMRIRGIFVSLTKIWFETNTCKSNWCSPWFRRLPRRPGWKYIISISESHRSNDRWMPRFYLFYFYFRRSKWRVAGKTSRADKWKVVCITFIVVVQLCLFLRRPNQQKCLARLRAHIFGCFGFGWTCALVCTAMAAVEAPPNIPT